jgi:transposase
MHKNKKLSKIQDAEGAQLRIGLDLETALPQDEQNRSAGRETGEPKRPKVLEADRSQLRMVSLDLESAVPDSDSARSVWAFVEQMDLSALYGQIRSFEGELGRPAIDPKILMALWIQATLDGVGSAREVARLCDRHLSYQWICGGTHPNYHTLSDFRCTSPEIFNEILIDRVAVLMECGLVEMKRVAQDGMRVRASAGAGSFRRKGSLKELRKIAKEQVEALAEELDSDSGASTRRQEAARKRAADERVKKIERALEQLAQVEKNKSSNNGKKKTEARTSTTDPEAQVMKMADGGFRPAFNVHFVSDTVTKVIVTSDVNDHHTDHQMMVPLADQLEQDYDKFPDEWLVDGGCLTLDAVENLSDRSCDVFAPPRKPRKAGVDPTDVRDDDSPQVADWRRRMASETGKAIYKQRGATAELVNAHVRHRGLQQFFVRGLDKVRSVVLLHVITHNFCRAMALQKAF